MSKRIIFFSGIGAVLILLLSTFLIVTLETTKTTNSGKSPPAPVIWQLQSNQTFAQNSDGIFSVKWIDITDKEFHFFFVFRSPHPQVNIEADSYVIGTPTIITHLVTRVQILAHVQTYLIGVIHVEQSYRVHQVIRLYALPVDTTIPTWHLAILKQLQTEPLNHLRVNMFPGLSGLPEVQWHAPLKIEQVAYFRLSQYEQQQYIFVRIDDPVIVKIITQKKYTALAGSQHFPPPKSAQVQVPSLTMGRIFSYYML